MPGRFDLIEALLELPQSRDRAWNTSLGWSLGLHEVVRPPSTALTAGLEAAQVARARPADRVCRRGPAGPPGPAAWTAVAMIVIVGSQAAGSMAMAVAIGRGAV